MYLVLRVRYLSASFCAKPSSPMALSTFSSACNVCKPEGCVSHRNGMVSDASTVMKKVTYKVPIVLSDNNDNSKNCRSGRIRQENLLCKIQTIARSFLIDKQEFQRQPKKTRRCINASYIKPCFTENGRISP